MNDGVTGNRAPLGEVSILPMLFLVINIEVSSLSVRLKMPVVESERVQGFGPFCFVVPDVDGCVHGEFDAVSKPLRFGMPGQTLHLPLKCTSCGKDELFWEHNFIGSLIIQAFARRVVKPVFNLGNIFIAINSDIRPFWYKTPNPSYGIFN